MNRTLRDALPFGETVTVPRIPASYPRHFAARKFRGFDQPDVDSCVPSVLLAFFKLHLLVRLEEMKVAVRGVRVGKMEKEPDASVRFEIAAQLLKIEIANTTCNQNFLLGTGTGTGDVHGRCMA